MAGSTGRAERDLVGPAHRSAVGLSSETVPALPGVPRPFQKWEREGLLDRILAALAEDLRERGKVDLSEAFIDGTHAGAKRGS